ncbi:hypothetical protein NECAME_06695 [Necator americanus]|uniref:Uncharacterized protein n=1 Tax=Necator americanus TaxID=51031 RepID=W2TUS1_NECAM|nr:hypothetical protein NECAME_06695 [Necator americanus]ETN84811.1 hypothetical protein NECAME_06695 [Necator americanus]
MSSLLQALLVILFAPYSRSAGRCDLSRPPKSWAVTKGIGIQKWATAGVPSTGKEFCVTKDWSTGIVEVDYHIDLSHFDEVKRTRYQLTKKLWDNPNNKCVIDDPRIKVCFPLCKPEWQKKVVEAALSSGAVAKVAKAVEESLQLEGWGITVLQVDYTNPKTKLNASIFNDFTTWCSVYVGMDPTLGFPYLYQIQVGKLLEEYESGSKKT